MNDIQRYILEEHVEDFEDGIIGRRELLRRVTLITGSLAATLSVLATLGCNVDQPRAGTSPSASVAASASASPNVAYATPPPQATTDGITVRADDPRITAQAVEVKAPDGSGLIGYLARPKVDGRYGAVLVIHENRGLLEHIKDVTRRFATAGFAAIGVDLLSRQGGAAQLGDGYSGQLGNRPVPEMVKDLNAALDHLRAQAYVDRQKIAAIGFCFGGGMVWNLLASGADVRAAAPYYGPAPSQLDALGTQKAAVYAVYAGEDARITESAPRIEEQLKRSGKAYKINVFPGVGHAFHNDTGARYNAAQAQQAWVGTIDWFRQQLG